MQNPEAVSVYNEAGSFVLNDNRAALKNDEVDTGQMEGVRGYEADRASTYDYSFERAVGAAHFERMDLLYVERMGVSCRKYSEIL
jgi:hypothetical protein